MPSRRALAEAARAAAQVEFERTALQGKLRQAEDDVLRAEGELRRPGALYRPVGYHRSYRRELRLSQRTAAIWEGSPREQDASAAEPSRPAGGRSGQETQGQTALSHG